MSTMYPTFPELWVPDADTEKRDVSRDSVLKSFTGIPKYELKAGVPEERRDVRFTLIGAADGWYGPGGAAAIDTYEIQYPFGADWLGRFGAFWFPDWRERLRLVAPAALHATTIKIAACGYAAHLFGTTTQRRFLRIQRTDLNRDNFNSACHDVRVTGAVDNGDGTETLTITPQLPFAITTPAQWYVLFLNWVRLAEDSMKLAVRGRHESVVVSFGVVELVKEYPA